MTRSELKKYIRSNPTDEEAIRELFVNRRNPNAKRYPYPYDMPQQGSISLLQSVARKGFVCVAAPLGVRRQLTKLKCSPQQEVEAVFKAKLNEAGDSEERISIN